jgi:CubicO group peptidase (beta-lactamase class C family)
MLGQSHDDSLAGVSKLSWLDEFFPRLFGLNPTRPTVFGDACSTQTFGHWGVAGTLAWADPKTDVTFVLLTTKWIWYARDGLLGPASDLISESFSRPGFRAAYGDPVGGGKLTPHPASNSGTVPGGV